MERAADSAVTEALKREVIRSGVSQRQEDLVHIQGVGRHFDLLDWRCGKAGPGSIRS